MTTVIRYRTPYLLNNTSPLILSFALGRDVALCSVLGIPCLLAIGAVVVLVKGQLRCSELNQEFILRLDPSGKGLSDGTEFDSSNTSVPADVPSNVSPLTSTLQYTSSDGCFSRDLVYNPPPTNTST